MRFNPPAAIREGEGLPAGDPLMDFDGQDGVLIGLDTEGFGTAKMPLSVITSHPNQAQFAEVRHPGLLRNPGTGGDIIPPTPAWSGFQVQNPVTGTLKSPDGNWWVDETYFHGRPVYPGKSFTANIEAPRASAQLFYQFDPLFMTTRSSRCTQDQTQFARALRADVLAACLRSIEPERNR